MNAVDIFGIGGVGLILTAYVLSSNKTISIESNTYHWINLVGAVLAFVSSYLLGSIPFTVLQAIWGVISLRALIKNKTKDVSEI